MPALTRTLLKDSKKNYDPQSPVKDAAFGIHDSQYTILRDYDPQNTF